MKSKTFDHLEHKELPKLPLPKLQDTCEKYLKTLKPLLQPEEYSNTEKNVSNFLKGEGEIL